MKRENCYTWARRMRALYGGMVEVERSENYWGPHFLWVVGEGHPVCQAGEVYERVPVKPVKGILSPPLYHEGYVRRVR